MTKFKNNEGQFHPGVAWVATLDPKDGKLAAAYKGCGKVAVIVSADGEVLDFAYGGARPDFIDGAATIAAMASCRQLIVEHGTVDAALLNALLGGER